MEDFDIDAHEPKTYYAAAQTTPDIYASHDRLPTASNSDGIWHQWVVNVTLSGQCRLRTAVGDILLQPGDATVIRPHTWNGISVPASLALPESNDHPRLETNTWDVVYALFHPRPHWQVWLDALEYNRGVAIVHLNGSAREEFDRSMIALAQVYEKGGLLRDARSLNRLDDALISLFGHSVRDKAHMDRRIHDAIEFIHVRYADDIGVADMARSVELSISRFSALFVDKMRIGPAEYLERLRLSRAAEMLAFSGVAVADIARSTGYQNASYFARRFQLQYGLAPRDYRGNSRPDAPMHETEM